MDFTKLVEDVKAEQLSRIVACTTCGSLSETDSVMTGKRRTVSYCPGCRPREVPFMKLLDAAPSSKVITDELRRRRATLVMPGKSGESIPVDCMHMTVEVTKPRNYEIEQFCLYGVSSECAIWDRLIRNPTHYSNFDSHILISGGVIWLRYCELINLKMEVYGGWDIRTASFRGHGGRYSKIIFTTSVHPQDEPLADPSRPRPIAACLLEILMPELYTKNKAIVDSCLAAWPKTLSWDDTCNPVFDASGKIECLKVRTDVFAALRASDALRMTADGDAEFCAIPVKIVEGEL